MRKIEFLTLTEIIDIHRNQLNLYGGMQGIRDISLLKSAIEIPKSTFENKYLHKDLYEMAAAYTFHICQNHPFVDGNKRVALVSGLIFLDLNGIDIEDQYDELFDMMIKITNGQYKKNNIKKIFKKLTI